MWTPTTPSVGSATHYHADYVFPRWGPQMVKIVQLGAHIFYRYPGPLIKAVTALDVLDSFASRTLRDISEMARLRGARTVVVGIQPQVAFAGRAKAAAGADGLAACDLRCGRAAGR